MTVEVWYFASLSVIAAFVVGAVIGRWLICERLRQVLNQMKDRIGADKPWHWTVDAWAEEIDAQVTGRPSRVQFKNGTWTVESEVLR